MFPRWRWSFVWVGMVALLVMACVPVAAPAPAPEAAPVQEASQAAPEEAAEPPAASEEQVTLLVWDQHAEGADAAVTKITENFMKQHPNIVIQRELVPLEQMRATAKTALASGTGPDIIYHDVTPGRELFQAGLVMPLDKYADQYGWRDRFYPAGLQWTVVDDKITGLGLEYEFVGVFYNKTLLEQEGLAVPQTLSETLDFCRKAKELGYVPLAHSQNPGWQNYFSFTMPIHNYVGVDYMEKLLFENEGSWNTEDMVKALNTVYKDMKEAGCFVEDLNALDFNGAQDLFWSGDALMLPTGTWAIGGIVQNMPDATVEMMPWPAIEGGKSRAYTAGMGSAYFISSATKHPDEAAMYLDYLFSDEAVKIWIEEAAFIPPVPANTEGLEVSPLLAFALDTLSAAGTGTGDLELGWDVDLIVPETFNTLLRDGLQALWAGTKTTEEQMAELQKIWEERE